MILLLSPYISTNPQLSGDAKPSKVGATKIGAVLEEVAGVRLPTAAASGRGIATATGRLGALVRVGV